MRIIELVKEFGTIVVIGSIIALASIGLTIAFDKAGAVGMIGGVVVEFFLFTYLLRMML